jgi:FkbM family methyltransferase
MARAVLWQVRKRLGRADVRLHAYGLDLVLPRSSGSLSNYFYFGEQFEWETITFIDRYLRPGDVVLDVGANVGMFAYAALRWLGNDGRVICFEPLPWAAEAIEQNSKRNGLDERLRVHRLAASDRHGTVDFTADQDVSSHIAWTHAGGLRRAQLTVDTRPLDSIVPLERCHSLMKLDIEGAEFQALQGFEQHLARADPPVIVFEAHDHSLKKMGSSRQEVLDLLAAHDYEICSFDARTAELAEPHAAMADLIAVHRGALSQVRARLSSAHASRAADAPDTGRPSQRTPFGE